jgi:hypothetical protein
MQSLNHYPVVFVDCLAQRYLVRVIVNHNATFNFSDLGHVNASMHCQHVGGNVPIV